MDPLFFSYEADRTRSSGLIALGLPNLTVPWARLELVLDQLYQRTGTDTRQRISTKELTAESRRILLIKCQKCSKPATIHITEILEGSPVEFHLCEDHAREQLSSEQPIETPSVGAKAMAKLAKARGKGTDELDKQTCPICGTTFREFRSSGRLGCPHDYEVFSSELLPLLENIHGETQHSGKMPKHAPADSQRHTDLIKLRQSLRKAVADENYEEAARLRDRIRGLEEAE